MRQVPAAGEEADEGAAVGLTLSSGPAAAKVPDVTGMTEAEAKGTLEDAGLASASASQYDLTAPAGEVLAQLPEAGQEAVAGSPVGLLVSKGRPEVTVAVPDVAGMTADEATTTLADAALTAVLVEAYVADVPAGDVADQEPAPGRSSRRSPRCSSRCRWEKARRASPCRTSSGCGRPTRRTSWRPRASS